jgi:hypothetical protein
MKSFEALKALLPMTALVLSSFSQFAAAQGNLVVNGGFDTDASGWTIANVNVAAGGGYKTNVGNPPGSVLLYNPSIPSPPTASQTVTSLMPGAIYVISGDYANAAGKDVTQDSFGVAINGVFMFESAALPDNGWHSFNFDFTATSTSALLSLEAQLNGSDRPYYIDNISVQQTPEPANLLWLVGLGGIASGFIVRRKHIRRS